MQIELGQQGATRVLPLLLKGNTCHHCHQALLSNRRAKFQDVYIPFSASAHLKVHAVFYAVYNSSGKSTCSNNNTSTETQEVYLRLAVKQKSLWAVVCSQYKYVGHKRTMRLLLMFVHQLWYAVLLKFTLKNTNVLVGSIQPIIIINIDLASNSKNAAKMAVLLEVKAR